MDHGPTADERRRRRQLAEIELLLDAGHGDRAGGLLVEHLARFPGDAEAVGRLLSAERGPAEQPPPDCGP